MKNARFSAIFFGAICMFLVAATGFAGTKVDDTFEIKSEEIQERKKVPPKYKLVTFTHKKHIEAYKIACGSCHHDDNNTPLDLKMGDDVQRCAVCHTKYEKGKDRKDMMVLENAMHGNCIGCHKEINKASGKKKGPAPTRCGECHVSMK